MTDEMLRNPLGIIPPDQRPRVPLRFSDQRELLVSGLLDGGSDVAQRPVVVDAPLDKGHVVLFANNPIYRGETIGRVANLQNSNIPDRLQSPRFQGHTCDEIRARAKPPPFAKLCYYSGSFAVREERLLTG